ncbi:MAG: hypothetical protein Q8910_01590 [Bacteroidota bacterium]|nr:hypothetical protein [Bacteroidota bacterium]
MSVYLTPEELINKYNNSVKWTTDWQKPFDEYERIAGNKISKLIDKNMPKVNDGSLAASLIETPMQVLPGMQTGKFKVTNKKIAWLPEIANMALRDVIIPNANTQASWFDKELMALYKALKYGAQPRYNIFVSKEGYTGPDWTLPYIKHVKLEPGKFSVEDCNYLFLDVYFTEQDLKILVDKIENNQDVNTTWNLDNLKLLLAQGDKTKDTEDQNSSEKDKQVNTSGIKTTICFNRGVGAPFYMFSKFLPEGELLREWPNPDPTGDLPITMQFCYETLEGPFGIGRVELAGPTQNVLDFFTQMHVLATQIGLRPPKKVAGNTANTNLNSIVFTPDAIWQTGDAQVDVVDTSTKVYSLFANSIGLYKAQLQNLQGRTDASVSSDAGDPGFSKTPQGVKFQAARTNAQDNYLRGKADSASARMITKMINVYFATMSGADILEVAEEDKERLEKAGFFNDNPTDDIPSLSEVSIDYDELKAESESIFKFEYDPRPESDEDEKQRWLELIDIYASNPNLGPLLEQSGWRFDLGEAFKNVISNSGASNWEKVLTKIDPATESAGAGVDQQIDPQLIQRFMQAYQVDENVAKFMIAAAQKGHNEEDVLRYLEQIGAIPQQTTAQDPNNIDGEVPPQIEGGING